ncbi:hypothetical protein DXG01_009108 [Tephrocybe rancida]|nr:hypothetical protein DXG01_009108 [Tephrocybe rancida]
MNPFKFQPLVRSITIDTFVGPRYGVSFTRYIQKIVDTCPSLQQFKFLSSYALPSTASLPVLTSSITHLSFNNITPTILSLLGCTHNSLLSLSIILQGLDSPESFIPDAQTPFILPILEDLFITATVHYHAYRLAPLLELLLAPQLRRAFLASSRSWHLRHESLVSFLKRCGCHVRFLLLDSGEGFFQGDSPAIQRILDVCPTLEHLTLYPYSSFLNITHPMVRCFDIVPVRARPPNYRRGLPSVAWTQPLAQAAFPKLKHLREIVISHPFYTSLPPISAALPHDLAVSDGDAFALSFPGIELQHKPGLIQVNLEIADYFEGIDSDDSGSDYVSHYDEASSSSSSDASESGTESTTSVGSLRDFLSDDDDDF